MNRKRSSLRTVANVAAEQRNDINISPKWSSSSTYLRWTQAILFRRCHTGQTLWRSSL